MNKAEIFRMRVAERLREIRKTGVGDRHKSIMRIYAEVHGLKIINRYNE